MIGCSVNVELIRLIIQFQIDEEKNINCRG